MPLNAELTDRVETGEFISERLVFDSESTMSVPAYLLTPTARRRPRLVGGGFVAGLLDGILGGLEGGRLGDRVRVVRHPGAASGRWRPLT